MAWVGVVRVAWPSEPWARTVVGSAEVVSHTVAEVVEVAEVRETDRLDIRLDSSHTWEETSCARQTGWDEMGWDEMRRDEMGGGRRRQWTRAG
jgi:hypothetical protein